MPNPPPVKMKRMFHPIGLPKYHLCAAKPPKNSQSNNAVVNVLEFAIEFAAGEVSATSSTTSTLEIAVLVTVRTTGNDA